MQPLINGTAYSWSQIVFNILGTPIAGITAIDYKDAEEMEDHYGAGNRPVQRAYGKIECTGSITLHMTEVEALQNIVPSGRLQDIPEFDIVISFLPTGGKIVNHTLKNVKFKENGRDMARDSMEIEVEIPLQISHINWK